MKIVFNAACLAVMLMATAAAAEDKRMPVTPKITEQKAAFVTNLVTDSAAIRAIEASDDAEAKALLARARELVDAAKADGAAGRTDAADKKLNEAIALVMAQTKRVSQEDLHQDRAKQLFELRKGSVKALAEAYDRVAAEKGASGAAAKRDMARKALADADALAAAGEHAKAVPLLDQAYAAVSADLAALRDGDKLIKELKFDTPKDEYVYEVDRNDSHLFLLKLALDEKKPDPMIVTQAEKMRGQASDLRKRAEGLAGAEKYQDAIRALNDSTEILIKAMRMTGLYIPG